MKGAAMDKTKKKGASMVAHHPPTDGKLHPVEELAAAAEMPTHALAGMCRANGWAHGKHLTVAEFETAMEAFAKRQMGSGRN
jgi:hypothetical protein